MSEHATVRIGDYMSEEKLKECLTEIQAVLKKHDLPGAAVVVAPKFVGVLRLLSASWSPIENADQLGVHDVQMQRVELGEPTAVSEEEKKWTNALLVIAPMATVLHKLSQEVSERLEGFTEMKLPDCGDN